MRIALGLLITALAAVGVALALVTSGRVDVAATSPDSALARWVFATAMESAVRRHAAEVAPPASANEDEDASVRAGAVAYAAMCAECHGAPGVEPGVVGQGLEPEPPDLAKSAQEWTPEELFWITAHGIRMTGMPAFGPTHSDAELWEVVAFVRRLPHLSASEYRALLPAPAPAAPAAPAHGHSHEH